MTQEQRGETLLLTGPDIARAMTGQDYIAAMEDAFARHADGRMTVPGVVHIPAADGAFHVKSAAMTDGRRYTAVKVNGNFPANRQRHGLPTIQGVIALCDGNNGAPLAILDSAEITAQRTAAASAVAARYLADPDARVATIIGCGVQGRLHALALQLVLPLRHIYLFDTDTALCVEVARELSRDSAIPITPVAQFIEGTLESQVIVTCTTSRSAFLRASHVRPGVFIAAVGGDNPDKQELDPALLAQGKVVADILEQCRHMGELSHALQQGVMRMEDVYGELGEIVVGRKAGQLAPVHSVIFDSTGSAIQDVAAAGMVYERACAQNLGQSIRLAH